jgi:hypothetical protein
MHRISAVLNGTTLCHDPYIQDYVLGILPSLAGLSAFNVALGPPVHQVGDVHSAQAGSKVPPGCRGVRLFEGFIRSGK